MTNLLTSLFESKKVLKISKSQIFPVVPPILIVAFKNGGTAVHDFKGSYHTQIYLPRKYAYRWVCLELLYPAAAFMSAYLKKFLLSLDTLLKVKIKNPALTSFQTRHSLRKIFCLKCSFKRYINNVTFFHLVCNKRSNNRHRKSESPEKQELLYL